MMKNTVITALMIFCLPALLDNLFVDGDLNRTDAKAHNVKVGITLPDGYSFSNTSSVKTKDFTFDEIDMLENISETVYLQNPPLGKSTMTAKITGDNVKETSVKYDFTVEKYVFEINKYRANHITNSDLGNDIENTYFNLSKSPSQQLRKAGRECGMDGATTAWNVFMDSLDAVDNPSKIMDYAFEEKDMYEAIIMSMFETSVDVKILDCINSDIAKDTKELLSTVISLEKNKYNFDLLKGTNLKKLSDKQRREVASDMAEYFKNDFKNAAALSKGISFISEAMKYVSDVQSLCEKVSAYFNILSLSDSMKHIMQDMYNECPSDNPALKQALKDCIEVMNSGDDEFMQKLMVNFAGFAGKNVAQAAFDKFWDNVKTSFSVAHPAAYVFKATYEANKYVVKVCWNSDELQEKYCKIIALVNTENVLKDVYNSAKNNFKSSQTEQKAAVYNSAIDIMFNMLDTDCKYATAFADALDDSLAGKISNALGDTTTEDFKKQIKSIQDSTYSFYETVLTHWIGELQLEGNERYKEYLHLVDESIDRMKKKYNISCPVDVYVFDTDGVIVGSVVDNVPYCRSGADITISVEGDKKTIYMYGNNEYNIVYEGNDTGTMDIAVTEYDNENNSSRDVYFNGLELTDGLKYTSTENGTVSEDNIYNLMNEANENITPDYDSQTDSNSSTYTVSIERGYFIDDTAVSRDLHSGENAQIAAYVPDGYKFIGWTSDAGEDIFEDASSITTKIRMPAQNVNIRANIVEQPRLEITERTDTSVAIQALACDDINSGIIILAVYDENSGALKNVFTEDFEQEVIFDNLDLNNCTVKVMLWNELAAMMPLADTAEQ